MCSAAALDLVPLPSLTLTQWAALTEDVAGEWVDGRLVEEEVPNLDHEVVLAKLFVMLGTWFFQHQGFLFGSGVKYALNAQRGRIPDLSAFFPESEKKPTRGSVLQVPPDVAIEIVSPSLSDQKRDRIEKLSEYAIFGVRYYWLVDPQMRSLEILELSADGRYIHVLCATEETIAVPGCSGLELDVSALWAELDRLG